MHQVRLSSSALYAEDFAPAADLTSDEHTIALYKFDEGQGDVLHDSSGHNRHGKIVGATWTAKINRETSASAGADVPEQ
jgi:hypothetical protein